MFALNRSTRCRTVLVSAAVIVAATTCCSVPNDDTAAAKAKIADAQAKYEAYSADIEMTMGSGDTSMKSFGNVRGKADLYASRASVDMSGNKQQYLTVKDAAGFVWQEQEHEDGGKSVTKSRPGVFDDVEGFPLADAMALLDRLMTWPGNLKDVLTSYANQYELKTAREDALDGEQVFVFEGPMKESVGKPMQSIVEADAADNDKGPTAETLAIVFRHAAELATIRITIAQADGLPRIIEASRLDGTPSMKQTFKNVIINAPVEDAAFVYTPTPGVRVIEMFSSRHADETPVLPSP